MAASSHKHPGGPQPSARLSLLQRVGFTALIWIIGSLVKLLSMTWRISEVNKQAHDKYFEAGKPSLLVVWHRAWLGGVCYMGPRWHPAVMASLSKDGELVSRFERFMGCWPIRGSSSRGGVGAQKAMVRFMKSGGSRVATNVADGPQGPPYVAKAGMISLAQLTGAPLIPAMYSSDRVWCLRKAWDKTMIPKPFAKFVAIYGEPIEVPRRLTPDQREQYRQRLEDELNRVKDEADAICGYSDPK